MDMLSETSSSDGWMVKYLKMIPDNWRIQREKEIEQLK